MQSLYQTRVIIQLKRLISLIGKNTTSYWDSPYAKSDAHIYFMPNIKNLFESLDSFKIKLCKNNFIKLKQNII